jgi:hypothetical protein
MHRYRGLQTRRVLIATAICLWLALDATSAAQRSGPGGNHGTAVHIGRAWEAVHQAEQEKKLLLLVHLSGVFEDPAFT